MPARTHNRHGERIIDLDSHGADSGYDRTPIGWPDITERPTPPSMLRGMVATRNGNLVRAMAR